MAHSGIAEFKITDQEGAFGRLHDRMHMLKRFGFLHRQSLEQAEDDQRSHSLRGGRPIKDSRVGQPDRQWVDTVRMVRFQIRRSEWAARMSKIASDAASHLASVKIVKTRACKRRSTAAKRGCFKICPSGVNAGAKPGMA